MAIFNETDPAIGGAPVPTSTITGNTVPPNLGAVAGAGIDPGLASMLGVTQPMAGGALDITSILQETLTQAFGEWGTASVTTDKYRFNEDLIPDWIKESRGSDRVRLMEAIRATGTNSLDPFIPLAGNMETWQVYMGGRKKPKHKEADDPIAGAIAGAMAGSGATVTDSVVAGVMAGSGKADPTHEDDTETLGAVINQPYLWAPDQVQSAIQRFQEAGFTNVVDFESMHAAWGGLVKRAGAMYSLSHGKKKVTPWDVLDMSKDERAAGGAGASSGGFTGTHKMTNRTVTEISEGSAWSALKSTLSQMLGREPQDDEIRHFAYRMNSMAAKNPSISTTIAQYNDGKMTTSDTKTKPGFGADDVMQNAYEEAQSDPDYAEYQSATTYFNAALSALGSIGNPG